MGSASLTRADYRNVPPPLKLLPVPGESMKIKGLLDPRLRGDDNKASFRMRTTYWHDKFLSLFACGISVPKSTSVV
jgi:hypothetical protein